MKVLFLIPVLCLMFFGCQNQSTASKSQSNAKEHSPDWEITTKAEILILADTSISASSRFISISTNKGVVTLKGKVSSRDDMHKIVRLVETIEGVQRVDNQMTVEKD